jgi:hypothetical protein
MRRFNMTLVLLLAICALFSASAQAATPAWRTLAVTGPTNLPPMNSEIQQVAVDATGGTYALTFGSETTGPIAFDATPTEVKGALDALLSIGGAGGAVEVSGGPGGAGANAPYFVRFRGGLAQTDVSQMTADASGLSGGAATATVSTTTQGASPGEGVLTIYASNVGGADSAGIVELTVGPLPPGIETAGNASGKDWTCPATGAGQTTVTCTRTSSIPALSVANPVNVPLRVTGSAAPSSSVKVVVSGGAAAVDPLERNAYAADITVSDARVGAGVQAIWAGAFDEEGNPSTQASDHPNAAATMFLVNTNPSPLGFPIPAGDPRDVVVDLPPGFVGNPMVTDRCPRTQPLGPASGSESACDMTAAVVGAAYPATQRFGGEIAELGSVVLNSVPAHGYAAQFGFKVIEARATALGSLRAAEDFGVAVTSPNIPTAYKIFGSFFAFEGSPPAAAGKAFLTNPSSCAHQAAITPTTTIATNSWQMPSVFGAQTVDIPPVVGCDKLGPEFKPSFTFQPSDNKAASGVATTARIQIDQSGLLDPSRLAAPHLKDSIVTLPEGMTLNPAAANGLEGCSTAQIGLLGTGFPMPNPIRFNEAPAACPDASKIGTAEIRTPLLDHPLNGTVYLAAQDDNPFKSLLAMYIVVEDEETGITIKLPGEIKPNTQTGQLTAEFQNNPQVPFEDLTLNFRGGGPQSTLATPDVCGAYTTNAQFTPWSAPESGPPAQSPDSFQIAKGPGGSDACARSKAERPFGLGFTAGSTNVNGGANSPFTVRITRPDGHQELDRISITTPPGLLASLRGIGQCSEAQLAAAGASGRTGKQELANPSCPASSQVGTTTIGAGVGPSPLYVKTGKVYLAGPYKGAPLSLAFVVPAVAGPFDLGVQVVRTALRIDPKTAQVTAESDAIPQILKGIPLLVRDVRVDLDRGGFVRNPTNCEPMLVGGRVTGGSGAVANLASRFQVGGCDKLGFKPHLKLRLQGGTKRDKYQKVTATLTARPGDANIARTSVRFPQSIFLAQEHIRTVCTRVQFAADNCPKGSVYGFAEAETPLLDQPLKGPVYLRSSDNVLPDLVVALRGPDHQPIEVELAARTDSKNKGIRNTFDFVPDAPVSKFVLRMRGGSKSLLVTSRNICLRRERAVVKMRGQNGKVRNFRPTLKINCGKKNRKGKGKDKQGKSKGKPGKKRR